MNFPIVDETDVGLHDRERVSQVSNRPIAIDLCCGKCGGWAKGFLSEGYRVIGFDLADYSADYPGEFHQADVRRFPLWALRLAFRKATVIVASPPCEEFSRHQMPWTKRRNPPPPDLSIVMACFRIAREAGKPIVLENVRKAQDWLGPAKAHYGSRYLWGDVPALLPFAEASRKEHLSSSAIAQRAEIPYALAQHIARVFKPPPLESDCWKPTSCDPKPEYELQPTKFE